MANAFCDISDRNLFWNSIIAVKKKTNTNSQYYFLWLLQYVNWNSYFNCNECQQTQWHLLVLTVLLWSHTLMDDVVVQVLVFSWHQTGKTGLDWETQPSSFGLSNMEPNISNPSRRSAVKLVQQWELEGEHTVTTWLASWPQSCRRYASSLEGLFPTWPNIMYLILIYLWEIFDFHTIVYFF